MVENGRRLFGPFVLEPERPVQFSPSFGNDPTRRCEPGSLDPLASRGLLLRKVDVAVLLRHAMQRRGDPAEPPRVALADPVARERRVLPLPLLPLSLGHGQTLSAPSGALSGGFSRRLKPPNRSGGFEPREAPERASAGPTLPLRRRVDRS